MKNLTNAIFGMALFVAGASAFAWTDKECRDVNWEHPDCKDRKPPAPTPTPTPVNAIGTGNGGQGGTGGTGNGGTGTGGTGTGYGGHGTADAAASAWQTMSAAQRAELTAKLTSEQRQELMNTINAKNENKNLLTNTSPSSASSSLTGNMTTTTIGGTNYNYSAPVAGAFVQLPPGIMSHGTMVVTTTACSGDFIVEDVRRIQATSNVGLGLWTTTRDNGVVAKTKVGTTGLVYGDWTVTGSDGDKLVEERTVNGYQAVIYAYLAGSSASSGLALNAQNGAGALSGSGGIQTFGKEIDKVPCSFKETRRLSSVKSASADELAGAIASRLSLKQELSAPAYEREFVKCPPKGCTAPTKGYYRYVRKDGSVKASSELSGTSKAEVKKP